ncbi:MAG: TIGR02677 family protein [Thermodesulfobacteriota bacterium]
MSTTPGKPGRGFDLQEETGPGFHRPGAEAWAPPLPAHDVQLRLLNQVPTFHYVTVQNAPTYRAIVHVFYEAKQHYTIGLRPHEVLDELRKGPFFTEIADEQTLDYHLAQLVTWENLTRTHDTAAVSRIEDFYRKRHVFHLTAAGEAAHRAVLEVEATVGRSGSLQTNMLVKVRDALQGLVQEAGRGSPEPDQVVRLLHDLHTAFATLTEEANIFIGELNRHTEGEEEDRFALRKQAVLAYIGRFIEKLRQLAAEITASIGALHPHMDRVTAAAATSADLPPALGDEDPITLWTREQNARWEGVRSWFVGSRSQGVPTVERLAGVAVGAVIGLTRTLGRLNDRRSRPIDRAADFRVLAHWFAICETESEAHELWHAAFGLGSARHFHLAEEDVETTSPGTSWWDAPPSEVPVRLRTRGEVSHAGRPSPVADHSREKEWIAQRRRREREQLEAAVRRFADRGPLWLSDIATLDANEFDLLLELLDEALSAPRQLDRARSTQTSDGRLSITLELPGDSDSRRVTLITPRGRLRCRDYCLTVSETTAGSLRLPRKKAAGLLGAVAQ